MNLDDKEKWVWLTLTYNYIEGAHREYKSGRIIWMSIGPDRCGRKDIINPFGASNLTKTLQPTTQVVSESAFPWISPSNGYILGFNGHMHDGGVDMDVFRNGEKLCTTHAKYSNGASSHGGMGGHGKRQMGPPPLLGGEYDVHNMAHISGQETCAFDPPLRLTKGDQLHITSHFDFNLHPG
jgi:hypothetical protein